LGQLAGFAGFTGHEATVAAEILALAVLSSLLGDAFIGQHVQQVLMVQLVSEGGEKAQLGRVLLFGKHTICKVFKRQGHLAFFTQD